MIFRFLFILVVIGGGGYLIYYWARTSWKRADVEQKIADNELDAELYEKIKEEESEEIKDKKEKLDDFLEDQ